MAPRRTITPTALGVVTKEVDKALRARKGRKPIAYDPVLGAQLASAVPVAKKARAKLFNQAALNTAVDEARNDGRAGGFGDGFEAGRREECDRLKRRADIDKAVHLCRMIQKSPLPPFVHLSAVLSPPTGDGPTTILSLSLTDLRHLARLFLGAFAVSVQNGEGVAPGDTPGDDRE